jgi:hypothetical protein
MTLYRVRLKLDRGERYVDVNAKNADDAAVVALYRNGNAISALCVGETAELERHGRVISGTGSASEKSELAKLCEEMKL